MSGLAVRVWYLRVSELGGTSAQPVSCRGARAPLRRRVPQGGEPSQYIHNTFMTYHYHNKTHETQQEDRAVDHSHHPYSCTVLYSESSKKEQF